MSFCKTFNSLLIVLCVLGTVSCRAEQALQPLEIRGEAKTHRFNIEVVNTPEAMARGLMGRTDIAPDYGMLFVFPTVQHVTFWMHDTPSSLDMLFIDDKGRIDQIHANARPMDDTPIPSDNPVRAVLEIAGGQAAEQGLQIGDRIDPSIFGEN